MLSDPLTLSRIYEEGNGSLLSNYSLLQVCENSPIWHPNSLYRDIKYPSVLSRKPFDVGIFGFSIFETQEFKLVDEFGHLLRGSNCNCNRETRERLPTPGFLPASVLSEYAFTLGVDNGKGFPLTLLYNYNSAYWWSNFESKGDFMIGDVEATAVNGTALMLLLAHPTDPIGRESSILDFSAQGWNNVFVQYGKMLDMNTGPHPFHFVAFGNLGEGINRRDSYKSVITPHLQIHLYRASQENNGRWQNPNNYAWGKVLKARNVFEIGTRIRFENLSDKVEVYYFNDPEMPRIALFNKDGTVYESNFPIGEGIHALLQSVGEQTDHNWGGNIILPAKSTNHPLMYVHKSNGIPVEFEEYYTGNKICIGTPNIKGTSGAELQQYWFQKNGVIQPWKLSD